MDKTVQEEDSDASTMVNARLKTQLTVVGDAVTAGPRIGRSW